MVPRKPHALGHPSDPEVAEILRAFARRGDIVIDDVELPGSSNGRAHLQHILVDECGVLIVHSDVRTNAQVRGTSLDETWVALYPGKLRAVFPNPLLAVREEESLLRTRLAHDGIRLDPSLVRGLVVFVGGTKIDRLGLDSGSRERVTTLERLGYVLALRHEAAPIAGYLGRDRIDAIAHELVSLRRHCVA